MFRPLAVVCGFLALSFVPGCASSSDDEGEREPAPSISAPTRRAISATSTEAQTAIAFPAFTEMLSDLSMRGWDEADLSAPVFVSSSDEKAWAVEFPIRRSDNNDASFVGVEFENDVGEAFVRGIPEDVSAVEEAEQALSFQQGWCAPYACDYPIRLTLKLACVILDENPLGYALVRQVRTGYTRCNPNSPNWYANRCGGIAVCPGVQQSARQYTMCVDPSGNLCR